jgi:cytochrome c peroxidase
VRSNLAGVLSYPSPNTGVYEITKRPEDVGKFRAPTLRNIAVTAPYMHDGSIATLDEVIEIVVDSRIGESVSW